MELPSFPASELEGKRSVNGVGGDAASGDEKVSGVVSGNDQGRVEEKAIRGEVQELKGQGTGC